MGTRTILISDMAVGQTLLTALNPLNIQHVHDPLPKDTQVKECTWDHVSQVFKVVLESEKFEGDLDADIIINRSVEEIPTFTVEMSEGTAP